MSIGSILPSIFYEVVFVATLVFVPVVAWRGDIENYFFGMVVLYLCCKIIKRRSNKQLPAEGRAVFVSGCDSEFGSLTVKKLDEIGFKVFAGCPNLDTEKVIQLKKDCSERVQVVQVDVTDDDSVRKAGQFVSENTGEKGLWAVINDSGLDGFGDFELCTLDTFQRVMDVNCYGTIRLTQQFLPLLRQTKGRVIIMSSIMASFTRPGSSAYSASKMAVRCVGDCLRMEMAKFGVSVCMIESPMFMGTTDDEKSIKQIYQSVEGNWEKLSEDVKSTYSTMYLKAQLGALAKFRLGFGSKTPDALIDAVVEAVSGSSPPSRNTVHGGPFMFDPVAVYAGLHPYLPEFLSDWFLRRVSGHSDTQLLLLSQEMTNGHVDKRTNKRNEMKLFTRY